MGSAATSAEQVRLAETRQTITALERITAKYQVDLDRVQPLYGDIAARHSAYRATETQVFTAIKQLATDASTAELGELAALVELAAHSDNENATPQQLIVDAKRVQWDLAQLQAEYELALAPHRSYLTEKGLPVLDHTSAPRTGMENVVAYAEGRMRRVNDAVRAIYDGIRRRESALMLAASDAATREQLRAADGAQREAAFLNEITSRVADLWKAPPTSALALALQGERFRAMTAFCQLEALCNDLTAAAMWRGPGCQKIATEATKVRTYLTQTLPFILKFGVQKMRAAGFDRALLTEIEARVTAGELAHAVHLYDAVLRAAEEG